MKKLLIALFLVFLFTGCVQNGIPVKGISTGDIPIERDFQVVFLFEYKGVAVFRFLDGGYYRYFTIGNGEFLPQVQSREIHNGKTTTTEYWIDGAEGEGK